MADELAGATVDGRSSCNQPPVWLARLRARFPGFSARYLELDPRSLGLARIYLGALLLLELLRRLPELDTFFTNDGLLPNHAVLRWPGTDYVLSFFLTASHLGEVLALFALCAWVFGMLLAGTHTRLFQLLSFVCIHSLQVRTVMFEDGSEVTTRLLVFWTWFLPLGARFSLDARRARTSGATPAAETRPVVSLAALAILLQLAAIYFFNALYKDGETWRNGSAVHYVLHQDRIVTWLGWLLRSRLSPSGSAFLSWTALSIEAALPLLLLSPLWTRATRRIAIALGIGLHVGFALLLNLGMFSANMIGFFLLLLSDRDWDLLARLRPARWLAARLAALAGSGRAVQATSRVDVARARGPAWLRALWSSETAVLLAMLLLGQQLLRENRVPRALRPHRPPEFLQMWVEYPRLYEGWSMFAPEAPKDDLLVYVDAVTVDGRHVDPLNQAGSRIAPTPPLHAIPERLGQSDSFCDYNLAIVGRREYQAALEDWLYRYPERTGNPRDQLVSFHVFVLQDDSPPPGKTEATNVRQRLLFRSHRRGR